MNTNQKGYIAITTAIVLSLVVVTIALSLGAATLFTRSQILEGEFKKSSFAVARSCLDKARLELALNSNYSGNATTTVNSYTCYIGQITTVGNNKIIKVRAQVQGATTDLKLTVNGFTLSTVQLEELSNF